MFEPKDQPLGRPVRPASNEPGTYEQQLAVIAAALYLAKRRRSNRREQWADARALLLPHARGEVADE